MPTLALLSRRRLLQGMAAAAALALCRARPARAAGGIFDDGNRNVPAGAAGDPGRVIVIGAGFAGLTAANALANAGVEVVVLEGRRRLGGRTWTREVGGAPVDMGAAWIHSPNGNPMSRFADQVGVTRTTVNPQDHLNTFMAFDSGRGVQIGNAELLLGLLETFAFDGQRTSLLATLGDRATMDDAIRAFLSASSHPQDFLRIVEAGLRFFAINNNSGEPNDISLYYDTFGPRFGYGGIDQRPDGGYVRLVEAMASGLDVRLNHAVTRVRYDAEGVVVHTRPGWARGRGRGGRAFRGSHVVVTVPLGVLKARSIRFDPFLPFPKLRAIQRLGFGFFEKIALYFPEPFWTQQGRTWFFHVSEPPERMEWPLYGDLQFMQGDPILLGSCGGAFARSLGRQGPAQIRERAVEILRQAYGPSMPEPSGVAISRWGSDPFTRGGYSFFPVGAVPADMDTLAQPVGGRVLFAGEATFKGRHATADGAMTSGIREAKRLLGQPSVVLGPLASSAASALGDLPEAALGLVARWRSRGRPVPHKLT